MTYLEIMNELAAMKSHFDSGFSVVERTRIVEMYRLYLGKSIHNLSCDNCYRDAFIEIYSYLKKQNKLPMNNYQLKNGHYLHKFGSADYHFNPISDEVAEKFLKENPALIDKFEKFPEDWKNRLKGKKNADAEKPSKGGAKGGRGKKNADAENAPAPENDADADAQNPDGGDADNDPQNDENEK